MLRWLLVIACLAAPLSGAAQNVVQPVLVLDLQMLVRDSQRGQKLIADKEAVNLAFQRGERERVIALEAEERDLAERRASMPEDEFAVLANAFDEKVVASRQAAAQRNQQLQQQISALDAEFQAEFGPIVVQIMRERGAGVVLQKQVVFVNGVSADITADVISRMDKAAGLD